MSTSFEIRNYGVGATACASALAGLKLSFTQALASGQEIRKTVFPHIIRAAVLLGTYPLYQNLGERVRPAILEFRGKKGFTKN